MANLINLNAGSGADYVTGDSGTTPGVSFKSSATEGIAFGVARTIVSSPTVALFQLALNSTASAPVFDIPGQGFVSATTILFSTGATAGVGAIRVKYGDNYGWIPVLPGGSVTAAAR